MSDLSFARVHRPAGRQLLGRLIRLSVPAVILGLFAYQMAFGGTGSNVLRLLLGAALMLPAVFLLTVVLFMANARTEVGPDGIRNRVLGTSTHIPWVDIEDVEVKTRGMMRTSRVVLRRGGRIVRLSALRDGPTMPDPDFDDTIEVIRQRIAHHRSADPVPQSGASG